MPPPEVQRSKRRHTLLVVDDEPDVVQSVQDLLRLDYRVLGATSAVEGMRLLEDSEVHIVMTDQRMPGMTGVEFLTKVRGEHPEAIRLLFTGYADIRAVIDAINQGNVFRYITKPWDPEELQSVIKQAAEQYDLLVERKRLLAELQAKNRELERANQLKDAFIKVASHELRTPLTILQGLTELAMRSPDLAPVLRDWLTGIERAGQRLTRLTQQIIQMLLAGKFEVPLDRQPTDLESLLREAAGDIRPFIEQRKQTLELDVAPDLGMVDVDAGKIRIVLDNLLLNAVKFTQDGGKISVRARRLTGGGVEIQVTDTGVGIDPDALAHLFEPFFTGFDVSRHSSGHFEFGRRGLGLGLSLARAFVEMHGGLITVASTAAKGSTFTVTLPAR
jgi:signal transduction histidine kinase